MALLLPGHRDEADVIVEIASIREGLDIAENSVEQLLGGEVLVAADGGSKAVLTKFFLLHIVGFVETVGKEQYEVIFSQWRAAGRVLWLIKQSERRSVPGIIIAQQFDAMRIAPDPEGAGMTRAGKANFPGANIRH